MNDSQIFAELYREAMIRDHGPLMLISAWFQPSRYSMNPDIPPAPPFASAHNPIPLMKLARTSMAAMRSFDKELGILVRSRGTKYADGGVPCPVCGDEFCPGSPPTPFRKPYGTPFLIDLLQGQV